MRRSLGEATHPEPRTPLPPPAQVVFKGHDDQELGIIYSLQPHNFTPESVAKCLVSHAEFGYVVGPFLLLKKRDPSNKRWTGYFFCFDFDVDVIFSMHQCN